VNALHCDVQLQAHKTELILEILALISNATCIKYLNARRRPNNNAEEASVGYIIGLLKISVAFF